MIRTQQLPLYTQTYSFVREMYRIKIKLPKFLKHDLGQMSVEAALGILKGIVLANKSRVKEEYISQILLQIEAEWTFLRLMFDLKGISEGEFKNLSERLSEITKQTQSWKKWEQGEQAKKRKINLQNPRPMQEMNEMQEIHE